LRPLNFPGNEQNVLERTIFEKIARSIFQDISIPMRSSTGYHSVMHPR